MAGITASQVKELRDATNVSMMECKKALVESDGDLNTAMKLLRERGMAVAAKRASKAANQGIIASAAGPDEKTISLVEVNCETDFVARNADFKAFVDTVAARALESDESISDAMQDELIDKIAAIGENIKIRRNARFTLEGGGEVTSYIHLGGKVGVLVELGCVKQETAVNPEFKELARDLTLHIAACSPAYLTSAEVPAEVLASEREIFAKQVEGKPAQIVDKIVDGKVKKFYADVCLVDQGFVKEPKQSISDLLAEKSKALDDTLTVRRYVRYQLGA